MSSQGNGLRNAWYFPMGVILAPILTNWIGQCVEKTKTVQLLCIFWGGMLCFLMAYQSSRVAPEKIFAHIFDGPMLASVAQMEGRKQYFDGFIWLLSFDIDDADFRLLCQRSKVEKADTVRSAEEIWNSHVVTWSAIAWDHWPRTAPADQFEVWRKSSAGVQDRIDDLSILRDPKTGHVWVIKNES